MNKKCPDIPNLDTNVITPRQSEKSQWRAMKEASWTKTLQTQKEKSLPHEQRINFQLPMLVVALNQGSTPFFLNFQSQWHHVTKGKHAKIPDMYSARQLISEPGGR